LSICDKVSMFVLLSLFDRIVAVSKTASVSGEERRHVVPNWHKPFTVAVVTRGDLTEVELSPEQIDSLSDAEMEEIAHTMADLYCENGYWQDLEEAVHRLLSQRHQDNRTTGGIYG